MLGSERFADYQLLSPITSVGLGHTYERLLMPMLHGLFKVVLQLGRMRLLLIQLPLSVIKFEREDVVVLLHLCHVLP